MVETRDPEQPGTTAAALAFYERAGFTTLAHRERYYRDGTTALVLELTLGEHL
jgi:ribosomal-protein-alanine N-acetyltransferase